MRCSSVQAVVKSCIELSLQFLFTCVHVHFDSVHDINSTHEQLQATLIMRCVLVYRLRQEVTRRISVVFFVSGLEFRCEMFINYTLNASRHHHQVWRLMKSVEFRLFFHKLLKNA